MITQIARSVDCPRPPRSYRPPGTLIALDSACSLRGRYERRGGRVESGGVPSGWTAGWAGGAVRGEQRASGAARTDGVVSTHRCISLLERRRTASLGLAAQCLAILRGERVVRVHLDVPALAHVARGRHGLVRICKDARQEEQDRTQEDRGRQGTWTHPAGLRLDHDLWTSGGLRST